MSKLFLSALFEDFDKRAAIARKHAIGGVLSAADLIGLYRRVATDHGCTPDDAKRWIEGRGK